jgi:alkanesulfonate monooxygenase SsuD/methylene tetrahydromethanopterin reductase-like flavin-dependent oxidoreductase (luciferase family)
VIIEKWNDIPFVEPYRKTRDMVRFLKDAFTGEKIVKEYDTFKVNGFRLGVRPEVKPEILVAGLREGMLKMAGRESDGAIINWLSPDDVRKVVAAVHEGSAGEPREIVARLFVCPSENAEVVREAAKFLIAAYLNVEVYAKFHEWLGRGPRLQGMWDAWQAGDRKAALAAIPDSVVDEIVVHGSLAKCRETIERYYANGVTTTSLTIVPLDPAISYWDSIIGLSPSAS